MGAVGVFKVEFNYGEGIEVTNVDVKSSRPVKIHTTRTRKVTAGGTLFDYDVTVKCYSPDDRQSIAERLIANSDPVSGKFAFTYSKGTRTYLCKGCLISDFSETSDQNGTVEDSLTFKCETREQIR